MTVSQTCVFVLLLYFVCSFLEGIDAQDRLTSLENKLEILDQKYTLLTVEMSELKLEIEIGKSDRMFLTLEVDRLKHSLSRFTTLSESVQYNKNNTISKHSSDNKEANTNKEDPNIVKQLLQDFEAEKNRTSNILKEIDNFKRDQYNLSERLDNTAREIRAKNEMQDIQINQTVQKTKIEISEMQKSLQNQRDDVKSYKKEWVNVKAHVDMIDYYYRNNTKLFEELNNRITIVNKTKSEIMPQEQLISNNTVAFSATLLTAVEDMDPWQVVVFNKILTNVGNGYSSETGEFTAPINGTYVFFAHIMGSDRRSLEMSLQVNKANKMYLYANGLVYGRDANMVVLKLNMGDKVTIVKHGAFEGRPFYVHPKWSTFSGFLLFSTD